MAGSPSRVIQGSPEWAAIRAEFVLAQAGVCAICKDPLADAQLDHCHSSGFIRGALCTGCNTRLGWYEAQRQNIEAYLRTADEFIAHRVDTRLSRSERLRHYWQHKEID